ncbi:MAG: trigger factor [Bifidobacteriaceae bacterium]|nr:trigger factor [Bifidobacteriaceae bacterium]
MKNAVETLEPTKVKITVEVTQEELRPSLDKAYKRLSNEVQVPGFRKGHVPSRIIDQRVGFPAVLEMAANESLGEWYGQAVEELKLVPLDQPTVELTELPDRAKPESNLVFTAEVEIRPEFQIPDLTGVELEVAPAEVTDKDIDEAVEQLRGRFATLSGVDRPAAKDDFVSVDLKAEVGGKEIDSVSGVSYQVGSGTMLDGLDEALDGLSAGETTTFEAPLAGGAHAGEKGTITVTVGSVKERQLPDLDDDFAQLASAFDTVDAMREDLRGQVAQQKRAMQLVEARSKLVAKLNEDIDVPVPTGLLDQVVAARLAGVRIPEGSDVDKDKLKTDLTDSSRNELKSDLILDKLAADMKVEVTQRDLVGYMVQAAEQAGMDASEFVEASAKAGRVQSYVADIGRSKGLLAALRQVTVKDSEGEAVDLQALLDDLDREQRAQAGEPEPVDDEDEGFEFDDSEAKAAAPEGQKAEEAPKAAPAKAAKKPAAKKAPAKKAPAKKPAAKTAKDAKAAKTK